MPRLDDVKSVNSGALLPTSPGVIVGAVLPPDSGFHRGGTYCTSPCHEISPILLARRHSGSVGWGGRGRNRISTRKGSPPGRLRKPQWQVRNDRRSNLK